MTFLFLLSLPNGYIKSIFLINSGLKTETFLLLIVTFNIWSEIQIILLIIVMLDIPLQFLLIMVSFLLFNIKQKRPPILYI